MSKINNPKTLVPSSMEMNDYNYLYDMLETEKNLSVNMVTVLNEASNEMLFDKIDLLFREIKQSQRDLFQLLFQKGWYSLEEESTTKIDTKVKELQTKIDELSE
jgi:hypothetical protein